MIILRKKRIIFILSCFIFSVCAFYLFQSKESNLGETIETVSLPVSNKVIVLDAGHGTPDEGAESSNGTTEAKINLKIAFKVQNLLEQSGATVILTRSDESAIYDLDKKTLKEKKISDIHNRVKVGNESSADMFVSIHLNKIPQQQYYGWQCFYKEGNEQSIKLAKAIQSSLNEAIQKKNERVAMKLENVYIIKHVEIPISIVECGFLSNPDEYQDKLAWGIYLGIMNYFSNE